MSAQWSIELDVRNDAPSMFVPAALLPDAAVGDLVRIASTQPAGTHLGRIVEALDDGERGAFFAVSLE